MKSKREEEGERKGLGRGRGNRGGIEREKGRGGGEKGRKRKGDVGKDSMWVFE